MQILHDNFVILPHCVLKEKPAQLVALCRMTQTLAYKRAALLNAPYIVAYPSFRLHGDLYTVEADLISVSNQINVSKRTTEDIRETFMRYGQPTVTDEKHYQKRGWAKWLQYCGYYSCCDRIKPEHIVSCCETISDILNGAIVKAKPTIEDLESNYGDSDDD